MVPREMRVSRRSQGTQTVGTGKNVPARRLCAERPSCGKAALSSISISLSRCGPLGLALALSRGAPHPLWVHRAHPRQAALRLGAERPWHPQPWVCWSRAPSTPVCSCGPGRAAAARQGPCQGRRWAQLQGAAYLAPGILGAGAISRVSRARSAFCPHLPACSGGATLWPSGDTTHRLPVPGPGPGVHSLTVHQVLPVGGQATCARCVGVFGSPSACGSLGARLSPRLPGH